MKAVHVWRILLGQTCYKLKLHHEELAVQETIQSALVMEIIGVRNWFMETAPPQIISVGILSRESKYETILEDSIVLASEYLGNAASLGTLSAMAPAPVISVKKKAYAIGLDTIWEETMQYAEYFVFEAADVILRPVLGIQPWESISKQFFASPPSSTIS